MFSIQELRSSTEKELLQELTKSYKEVLKVKINVKTKHEKDSSKKQKVKRYIAQILTVLKEVNMEEKNKESKGKKKKSEEKVELPSDKSTEVAEKTEKNPKS